ncbi:MAG: hypothetical protein KA259_04580, partial [Caldilineaceae bacterium]|nr:hypothetical protein [Caldilineaceae bacterium]
MTRPVWVVAGFTAWSLSILAAVATGVVAVGIAVAALLIPATLAATLLADKWRWFLLALAMGAVTVGVTSQPVANWLALMSMTLAAVALAAYIGAQ